MSLEEGFPGLKTTFTNHSLNKSHLLHKETNNSPDKTFFADMDYVAKDPAARNKYASYKSQLTSTSVMKHSILKIPNA